MPTSKARRFSDVVREAALEHVEDAADLLAYEEAIRQSDGIYYTADEASAMFEAAE